MLALLNLASGECAKRNSTGRAGIQNVLIFRDLPGFPFDFAQGGESFDFAQDREPVERPVEPRVSPNPLSSKGQACRARPE
jgi:hypothetical protein